MYLVIGITSIDEDSYSLSDDRHSLGYIILRSTFDSFRTRSATMKVLILIDLLCMAMSLPTANCTVKVLPGFTIAMITNFLLRKPKLVHGCDLLILHCGTNNCCNSTAQSVVEDMINLVNLTKHLQPGIGIRVSSILPLSEDIPQGKTQVIKETNKLLLEHYGVPEFVRSKECFIRKRTILSQYYSDHLHLNEAGIQKLSDFFERVIGYSSDCRRIEEPTTFIRGVGDMLSNFYPCWIVWRGKMYPSVEHAYQHTKALHHNNFRAAKNILRGNAIEARRQTRRITPSISWDLTKGDLIEDLLVLKFRQEPFKAVLLSACPRLVHPVSDSYWGCGINGFGSDKMSQLLNCVRITIDR